MCSYTFGESDSYHTVTWGMKQRLNILKKTKIPFFGGWGVWWCPLLPLTGLPLETVRPLYKLPTSRSSRMRGSTRIHTHMWVSVSLVPQVIGNPIALPKIPDPTPEDVEKWHAVYVDKLVDLFERNKANFGYPNRQLELF